MKLQHTFLAALLLFSTAGCDLTNTDDDGGSSVSRVFVANQGNFTDGNGSVTVYATETDQSNLSAISGFGSIVQSVAIVGDLLYVMANSGNRIDVFDRETLDQIAQISEVVSPRYMLQSGNTAYVTSLYGGIGRFDGGLVTVVDLQSNTKVEEIEVGNYPEGLALVGSRLYAANHGFGEGNSLHVIDTATHAVIDSVDVECDGPRFLAADPDDEIFVFCTGNTVWGDEGVVSRTDGAVRVLEGSTGEIIARIAVDGQIGTAGFGQDAFLAAEDRRIYAVQDGVSVLVFDTDSNSLIGTLGPFEGAPIGAVAYDAEDDRLYLGRSNGFTAAGEVSIHTPDGDEVDRFAAGVVPSYIAFDHGD